MKFLYWLICCVVASIINTLLMYAGVMGALPVVMIYGLAFFIDIFFTGVGLFERPTKQELQVLTDMHEQNAG